MKVIEPYFKFIDLIDGNEILKRIEYAGRICYKSEDLISADSAKKFVLSILANGHESVIEHEKVSVLIVCDRGITHEIVRHRVASYSQESTRYCNYAKNKFHGELTFIKPYFWQEDDPKYKIWEKNMLMAEKSYLELLAMGASPQEARAILPNSLKAEIMVTMNLREWRHFFRLRTAENAHPQMRQITIPLLNIFKQKVPVIFDDIHI